MRMRARVVVAPAADQATDTSRLMRSGPPCKRLRMGRECERRGSHASVFASRSALRITGMLGLLRVPRTRTVSDSKYGQITSDAVTERTNMRTNIAEQLDSQQISDRY